jgi:hypothetical protein
MAGTALGVLLAQLTTAATFFAPLFIDFPSLRDSADWSEPAFFCRVRSRSCLCRHCCPAIQLPAVER